MYSIILCKKFPFFAEKTQEVYENEENSCECYSINEVSIFREDYIDDIEVANCCFDVLKYVKPNKIIFFKNFW